MAIPYYSSAATTGTNCTSTEGTAWPVAYVVCDSRVVTDPLTPDDADEPQRDPPPSAGPEWAVVPTGGRPLPEPWPNPVRCRSPP
jgi:hypothetical protein